MSTSTPSQDKLGFQGEGFDWNEYIKYRPAYPPSFYKRLYDEHAKNLNTFGIANDVGAGAGIASEKLAEEFKKVIVSEPNAEYVKIAERRLNSLDKFPEGKFSFLKEGGEKSSLADGSLDCLTVCEALHWTHMETSINEFARCLKSGGTLGIFHYALPHFEDPELDDSWSKLTKNAAGTFKGNVASTRLLQNVRNGYQNISFDPKIWKEGVQRVFVNTEGDVSKISLPIPKEADVPEEDVSFVRALHNAPPPNNVGKTDVIEWIEGDQDWYDEVDAEWMRNAYRNMLPWKEGDKEAMDKFTQAIGDRKVKIHYPALQIIATKR